MTWFKIDDGFHGHPKVIRLPLEAVGLWALAGTWCADYLTDGALPMGAMLRLGGTVELADMLVEVNLWVRTDTGYRFREWEPYQPTKEQVLAEREAAKARMQRVRGGSGQRRAPDVRPNNEGTSPAVRLPRPDPSYSSSDEELSTSSGVMSNNASDGVDDGFDIFWHLYPRKVGKPTARKAWQKATSRASAAEIEAGLRDYLPVAATKEPQYIPHPSTWLNRDGWNDEHTPDATPMGNAMAVAAMGAAMEAQAQAQAYRELR